MAAEEVKKVEDVEDVEEKEEEEKEEPQSPMLTISQQKFLYQLPDSQVPQAEKEELKQKMLAQITEQNMAPYYSYLCTELGWMEDESLLAAAKKVNAEKLAEFDVKEKDAKENLGDSEVREIKLQRAMYLCEIGERQPALDALNDCDKITVGSGGKIDLMFAKIRVGLAFSDQKILKDAIEEAKVQVEKGGDWERRNLLKVYEATYLLTLREFKSASTLLLDSVATFGCYALFDYNQFIFYTVLVSLVSLDRVTLREKVVKAPEILQVIGEMPVLQSLLLSLYNCKYGGFFPALAEITKPVKKDTYLAPHAGFLMREIRIVAYKQFLEPYKSVTLESMARAFGVSNEFLDKELARFISAGRLDCKVDQVGGVVETVRPDRKEQQFTETIKRGDVLLNRVQKLSKFINY